ncbi:MAG: ATP synthase F1 subunit epsilon [bacterium]|nr:ATP synthase F1 subunit epsilon [bacterium]
MAKLHLKVVTPEKLIIDEEVDEVVVTTDLGEIGILPFHANLMSNVVLGEMRIKNGSQVKVLAVGSGLLQMTDNTLSVLTDLAQGVEEINEKEIEEARARAQAALEKTLTDEEYAETLAVLERSLAQLRVKRRHKVR